MGLRPDEAVFSNALRSVETFFDIAERLLQGKSYMAGNDFTLVDIYYIPLIQRLFVRYGYAEESVVSFQSYAHCEESFQSNGARSARDLEVYKAFGGDFVSPPPVGSQASEIEGGARFSPGYVGTKNPACCAFEQ